MGITIHFEGRLRGAAAYKAVMEIATSFATERGWPTLPINETYAVLHRVRDEEAWDYVGPTTGLVLQPHVDSDPLRLEFDSNLYIQEYVKTQFSPVDVHLAVVKLLKLLQIHFSELEVIDEGEYFDTGDMDRLVQLREGCAKALTEILKREPSSRGPVRTLDGRIIDVIQE